jgi:N-acetylglucosaminyldiphosphoundecaprenol N-acetyl-beta-D-mannosaminyltransferase
MANILGIKLSDLNQKEALKKISQILEKEGQSYAVTPNPEIILQSLKDKKLAEIINQADFSFADGMGLKLAGLLRRKKIERVTGSDLTPKLLNLAEHKQKKILIILWEKGLSSQKEVQASLIKKYPDLKFLILMAPRQKKLSKEIIDIINNFSPAILFVALGFPEQEKLIYQHLSDLKTVKFAIGVGGTFDFITNKIARAPKFLRYLGLEWLWRLLLQPKRLKRIYRATLVFMFKILTHNY